VGTVQDTHAQTQTDRQTDRQTDTHAHTHTHTHTHAHRQTDRQTEPTLGRWPSSHLCASSVSTSTGLVTSSRMALGFSGSRSAMMFFRIKAFLSSSVDLGEGITLLVLHTGI
jgi:hypothetical protein